MPEPSATIRASVNMKFYARFLLMGIGAIAAAGWFFKDGLVSWPHQQQVWNAYLELNPNAEADHHHGEHASQPDAPPEDFPQEEWDALVTKNGWQDSVKSQPVEEGQATSFGEPNGKPRTDWKIQEQLWLGGLLVIVGVALFVHILRARGMWIESDGTSVKSSWGQYFQFENVTEINKKKWEDKGLARVRYDENGRQKTFVVDDLKFDRPATDRILYQMEQAVGVEKIVSGHPETDPDAPPAEEPAPAEGDPIAGEA